MIFRTGRYSGFLRPITYGIDLILIHALAYYLLDWDFPFLNFTIFVSLAWIVAALRTHFYEIYRFTHVSNLLSLIGKQTIYFLLIIYTFFGIYIDPDTNPWKVLYYVLMVMGCISAVKLAILLTLSSAGVPSLWDCFILMCWSWKTSWSSSKKVPKRVSHFMGHCWSKGQTAQKRCSCYHFYCIFFIFFFEDGWDC